MCRVSWPISGGRSNHDKVGRRESLRRCMEQLPAEQTGWLTGTMDPVVGGALAILHRQPSHRWTLEELLADVGASRSVLTQRFTRFLGGAPLTYLARWRLQLAARRLQMTRDTILQVALDVGSSASSVCRRGSTAKRSPDWSCFPRTNSPEVQASELSSLRYALRWCFRTRSFPAIRHP